MDEQTSEWHACIDRPSNKPASSNQTQDTPGGIIDMDKGVQRESHNSEDTTTSNEKHENGRSLPTAANPRRERFRKPHLPKRATSYACLTPNQATHFLTLPAREVKCWSKTPAQTCRAPTHTLPPYYIITE